MVYRLCLLLICFLTSSLFAQNKRYLQQLDLTLKENQPYFSNTYSLPKLVINGIKSGEITAYDINYNENTVAPLSPDEFKKRLIMETSNYDYGSPDTIFYTSFDFSQVELDITKEKGTPEKINYLHFRLKGNGGNSQHHFSVSFTELASYLNKENALWVCNSSPWVWKGQVLHSDGHYVNDIISNKFSEEYCYVHLAYDSNHQYETFQIYNKNHELIKEEPYQSLLVNQAKAEIMLMSTALLKGKYTVSGEVMKKTTIPEAPASQAALLDKNFFIIQHEDIHLLHPNNAIFYINEKELPTLIMNAIENGKITRVYSNSLLTAQITDEEWLYNASEEVQGLNSNWENEDDEGDSNLQRIMYTGRSVTIVSVSWKKYFNSEGEIIAQMPHAIGLFVGPEQTASGFSKLLGYFSFNDIYHALKNSPEAYYNTPESGNFINDLMNRKYFSYWISTSGISVQSR